MISEITPSLAESPSRQPSASRWSDQVPPQSPAIVNRTMAPEAAGFSRYENGSARMKQSSTGWYSSRVMIPGLLVARRICC